MPGLLLALAVVWTGCGVGASHDVTATESLGWHEGAVLSPTVHVAEEVNKGYLVRLACLGFIWVFVWVRFTVSRWILVFTVERFHGEPLILTRCGCGEPRRAKGQRFCRDCHNRWMREHRPKHSALPAEQRLRANCRAYTNVLIGRSVLVKGPCEYAGEGGCHGPIEAHHDDYSKPRVVRWRCRRHNRTGDASGKRPSVTA